VSGVLDEVLGGALNVVQDRPSVYCRTEWYSTEQSRGELSLPLCPFWLHFVLTACTMNAGLKLVFDDIERGRSISADWRDVDISETLLDVQSACRIAVEILNDLLCFDKLESGILELHKHEVPVVPFITDCVDMFASQAREGGVALSVISCTADTDTYTDIDTGETSTPSYSPSSSCASEGEEGERAAVGGKCTARNLLESDTVFMDKFKMDQVLRNLISNALKFTPRGGAVTGEREEERREG
jgi:signal transduction histidine kinase